MITLNKKKINVLDLSFDENKTLNEFELELKDSDHQFNILSDLPNRKEYVIKTSLANISFVFTDKIIDFITIEKHSNATNWLEYNNLKDDRINHNKMFYEEIKRRYFMGRL
ncbi:hypothetical protein GCM10009117_25730 [Gangjinia marincola]|uniref:Uncharacterized protein n=1 Tax=Gangjinia marincola TaxID=578463 RepID=A0ABN1MJP8_9FLAO